MFGLMQDHPLLISTIFEHATKNFSKQEIVSNTVEGGIHRYTYLDWGKRTKKLANAFKSIDLKEGYVINCVIIDIPIINILQNKDVYIKICIIIIKTKKAPNGAFFFWR